MSRAVPPEVFHAVKSATRDLVTACGGAKRAASLIGVSEQMVSRYKLPTHDDILPLTCAAILEQDCGMPLVSSAISAFSGHDVVPAGEPIGATENCIKKLHAGVMRETADLLMVAAEAFADGRLTPSELDNLDLAVGDLMRALKGFRGNIARRKAGGGKAGKA